MDHKGIGAYSTQVSYPHVKCIRNIFLRHQLSLLCSCGGFFFIFNATSNIKDFQKHVITSRVFIASLCCCWVFYLKPTLICLKQNPDVIF